MSILTKIILIVILILIFYLWNRFIVKNMIKWFIWFHSKNSGKYLNKQTIRFIVEKEQNIYNFVAGFFWVGVILISVSIIMIES